MTSTEASSSEEKAATLRALHVPSDPLVLPSAWEVAAVAGGHRLQVCAR
jgi:2-methylisocitrate lyase-like PEP mutase family enzyme